MTLRGTYEGGVNGEKGTPQILGGGGGVGGSMANEIVSCEGWNSVTEALAIRLALVA